MNTIITKLNLAIFVLFFPVHSVSKAKELTKYNILFITVDDLRPELGCYGVKQIKTPAIDALAENGTVFKNAYCQMSWCSPSRTSLLTGLRPDRTGVYDLQTHFRTNVPNAVTLPQYFKENGYYSLAFGKVFHNSLKLQDSSSWNEPCWFPSFSDPLSVYVNTSNLEIIKRRGKPFAYPTEQAETRDEDYPDGQMCAAVTNKIRSLRDKAFFMAVGFYKPHLPYNAPKKYFDLYDPQKFVLPPPLEPAGAPAYAFRNNSEEKNYQNVGQKPYSDSLKRALTHGYYACVSYVDEQIRRIVQTLKDTDLIDKTIIVIWGDHGYKLGEYGRWSKHSNFEIDTRVPLIIYHPKMRKGEVKSTVESIDLYPTLCQMAGLPAPKNLAGNSLLSQAQRFSPRTDYAISQIQRDSIMGYTIRWKNYRYTQWVSMTNGSLLAEELYDHTKDPGETRSITEIQSMKPIKAVLAKKLSPHINFLK